jgi:hypothetical protein
LLRPLRTLFLCDSSIVIIAAAIFVYTLKLIKKQKAPIFMGAEFSVKRNSILELNGNNQ